MIIAMVMVMVIVTVVIPIMVMVMVIIRVKDEESRGIITTTAVMIVIPKLNSKYCCKIVNWAN